MSYRRRRTPMKRRRAYSARPFARRRAPLKRRVARGSYLGSAARALGRLGSSTLGYGARRLAAKGVDAAIAMGLDASAAMIPGGSAALAAARAGYNMAHNYVTGVRAQPGAKREAPDWKHTDWFDDEYAEDPKVRKGASRVDGTLARVRPC